MVDYDDSEEVMLYDKDGKPNLIELIKELKGNPPRFFYLIPSSKGDISLHIQCCGWDISLHSDGTYLLNDTSGG